MIAIIDYGAGNLASVKKSLDWLGEESMITSDPALIRIAGKMILPGVGHFASTVALLRLGLQEEIMAGIEREVPFLGICLGMQWMFGGSEESPETGGLNLFHGKCTRFPAAVKSPHVGWNQVEVAQSSQLFRRVASGSFMYFTHSYRALVGESTVASCDYGGSFCAAVERDHVFGVQFHPEKSGEAGLRLLRNFCELGC